MGVRRPQGGVPGFYRSPYIAACDAGGAGSMYVENAVVQISFYACLPDHWKYGQDRPLPQAFDAEWMVGTSL